MCYWYTNKGLYDKKNLAMRLGNAKYCVSDPDAPSHYPPSIEDTESQVNT